jgi:DNA-binding NarL/FixJ family response regulator
MYKVCLVEDNPDWRVMLADWLRVCRRLELLVAWDSGEEALKAIPRIKPDVILMDIKMRAMSGIECLTALRRLSPPVVCPIVMLTEYDDGELIFRALKAGADGYLLKRDASGKELETAVVEVMAGGGPMSPSIAHQVIAFFQTHQPTYLSDGERQELAAIPLTAREKEVLEFATQGLTYKEIASVLSISMDTVRRHFQNIFFKLHIHSRCDPRLYFLSHQREHRP